MLCVLLFATGCTDNTDLDQSSIPSTPSVPSSSISKPTESKPQNNYGNLLEKLPNAGKSVTAYGALEDEEFSAALLELEGVLKGYKHNISVAAFTLDNQKALTYNTETGIFGACTVKAAYTLYCLKEIEKGNGSLEATMTYEKKHYEPGTGDMQYSPFGTVFDMKTIISKCMSISDNVGYLMMVDYFGRDGYNEWITELGCPSLTIKPTVWSLRTKANELVIVWKEIYDYFKTDSEYSRFLYDICTNTPHNYATAALEGVTYSHKQGHNSKGDWLSYSDAGIVWKENNPYIIAVITDAPGPSSYDANIMKQIITVIDGKLF